MVKNPFKYSQKRRKQIITEQERYIKSIYSQAYFDSQEIFRYVGKTETESNALRQVYLNTLKKELTEIMNDVDKKTEISIKQNMDKMVGVVLENNQQYLNNFGYSNFINNPKIRNEVVSNILSGNVYQNKWSLSSAIWGDNKQKIKEINKIIANGVMQGRSVADIAKRLQKYVNPNVRNLVDIPGVRGKIDYNALRLARTTIQHAYQEAFVEATRLNPFIDAYKWVTSGGHNVCPLCIARETEDQYGLGAGIFPKDKLPIDHPNGQCTFDIVTTMSDNEISEAIADWYLGVGDESMNEALDEFSKSLE